MGGAKPSRVSPAPPKLDRQSRLASTARAIQHKSGAPIAPKPLVQSALELLPHLQPVRGHRRHAEGQHHAAAGPG
jgi:hypothetical protein